MVDPGPAYGIVRFALKWQKPANLRDLSVFSPKALGVEERTAARSETILEAERRVTARLGEQSYPFPKVVERDVVVDHAERSASVDLVVDPGPAMRFGALAIEGLQRVDPRFVRGYVPWREGDGYNSFLVTHLRRTLAETGVFSSVKVEPAREAAADGVLPIKVVVVEAKRHFVGGGVNYSTAEGPGAKIFWGDRNVFGGGEKLELKARYSRLIYGASADFRRPNVFVHGQDLLLGTAVDVEDTDAYESQRYKISGLLERQVSPILSVSGGVTFERSEIDENDQSNIFNLVGFPLGLRRDTTDNLLDPTKGGRLTLTATPYYNADASFLSARIRDSLYVPLNSDRSIVVAGWASVGSILGRDTQDIPADKRFYSGGGGSIRGYGYQLVGPLDADNDPIGGRSLIELGAEVRFKITDSIGLSPFIEAGNVYDTVLPKLGRKLLVGAGLGFRYYTPIGPLRLDVGVPLDRRAGVDDAFQVYISLGQAF
jgi:translocation and assembly module TamA